MAVANMEMLSRDNYATWKVDIKFALMNESCYSLVTGTEEKPGADTSKKEKSEYLRRKEKCMSILYYSIESEYRELISSCEEPIEAWEILANQFEPKSRAGLMRLFDSFFSERPISGEPVGLFINRIKKLVSKLKDSGHPLAEVLVAFQTIRNLPEQFRGIIQILYRLPDDQFTLKYIEGELIAEEDRLAQQKRDEQDNTSKTVAYYSSKPRDNFFNPKNCDFKNNVNNVSRFKPKKVNIQNVNLNTKIGPCYICKQMGHVRKQCKKYLAKLSEVQNKIVNCNAESIDKFGWVIDTAATRHFCNNRELFDKFKKSEGTTMSLAAGDHESPIEGVGSISMYVNWKGNKNVIQLNDVMYSPNLRRNLIAASILEAEKSRFVGKSGILTFYKPDGEPWFYAKRREGLYFLRPQYGEKVKIENSNCNKVLKTCKDKKFLKGKRSDFKCIDSNVFKTKNRNQNFKSSNVPENVKSSQADFKIKCNDSVKTKVNVNKPSKVFKNKRLNCNSSIFKPSKNSKFDIYKSNHVQSTTEVGGNARLWHKRFCHINFDYLHHTGQISAVNGLPSFKERKLNCKCCKLAKNRRVSFKPIGRIRSNKPLELVHMDVCGPMPTPSRGGARYFLSITDDYSRKVFVYPMKRKAEVFDKFKQFQNRAERFLNTKILNVRTDNGMEFCSNEFENFLNTLGIHAERTNTYTPEQNGVSERYNLTALDCIKAMLNDSNLKDDFWAEALLCFTYAKNRICHKFKSLTPNELYSGRKPSVAHLRTFGCQVFVGKPKQKRGKLDMRAQEGIMVGYALTTRGYRIWLLDEAKVIETSNVKFNEDFQAAEGGLGPNYVDTGKFKTSNRVTFISKEPTYLDSSDEEYTEREVGGVSEEDQDIAESDEETGSSDADRPIPDPNIPWVRKVVPRKTGTRKDVYYFYQGKGPRLRSLNEIKSFCENKRIKYNENFFNFKGDQGSSSPPEANIVEVKIPRNYKEAANSLQSKDWHIAMANELSVIKERGVWDLVPAPVSDKVIGCRWVYAIKRDEKGEVSSYKARLVAQGFSQERGQTYEEVFSPVINFTIVRLFFTVFVSLLGWFHTQLDVKCAYLYATLNEKIYMCQPPGFMDQNKIGYVCRLNKALYGLHQSGREWYMELDQVLKRLNFNKFNWCNCAYNFKNRALLIVYVDDIILFVKDHKDIKEITNLLKSKFDIKELGKTKMLLGIEFEEIQNNLFIHQTQYIKKVCDKFSKYKYPISSLPIAKGIVLSKTDCPATDSELKQMKAIPYRNLLGCISFLAGRTRPDISYTVNVLSQFQENPGMKHWDTLLKLLGYLDKTKNFKLNLSNVQTIDLKCFSDSDFAANRDDRVSMGGMIFFIDKVPISWRTFKHKCVSLSTMEAEYISLTESAKEMVWIQNILVECEKLGVKVENNIIYCDNQAAINFSNSPIENHRTKHIDIKYHFLRNLVDKKLFAVKFINSKNNKADGFTKPITKEAISKFCEIFET